MKRWEAGELVGGRLTLLGRLAAGGMAEVFVAELALPRGARRRVAIKRIHPHLADDPEFASMFADEARITSQLTHAALVPLIDVIESEGGLLIVSEYVPGWDLGALLSEPLPVEIAVAVGAELAAVLRYVHEASGADDRPLAIVHRDVSPSNVLIAEDGSVRLLDFGVAKAAARATRTATATIKGKIAYAAPEQITGRVDARTDLYALGLVLFEMLTGRRAIEGESDLARLEHARAPVHVAPSQIRAGVPAELDRLVLDLLAIDPGARPARASDVAARLESIAAAPRRAIADYVRERMGSSARPYKTEQTARPIDRALAELLDLGPATAAPPAPAESLERAIARRWPRALWAAPVLVIAGALAGLAWFAWPAPPPASPREEYGFVRVASAPSGARVLVDGAMQPDPTPAIVRVAAGQPHRIELRLDDHLPHVVTALRVEPLAQAYVDAELEREPGRLIVRSEPPGAEVRVDGTPRGRTPLELDGLARRDATIEIAGEGFEVERFIAPLAGERIVERRFQLRARERFGTLSVSSTPWARVAIDGRTVAESTPATAIRLREGAHTLVLENPRLHLRRVREIVIHAGRETRIVERLR